jgi:DNA-binding HxlR family transcriptional regulator
MFESHILSGKWNLPILAFLSEEESIRYNELKRKLHGITGTTLTNCLKDLIKRWTKAKKTAPGKSWSGLAY